MQIVGFLLWWLLILFDILTFFYKLDLYNMHTPHLPANQDAQIAIIVYSITSSESFNSVVTWIDELKQKGPENISTKKVHFFRKTVFHKKKT